MTTTTAAASGVGEKVLITGGGGWFGQRLAREMLLHGYRVVLMDVNFAKTDTEDEIAAAERIYGSVTDKAAVEKAVEGCNGVLHLAAYGMSGSASLKKEPTYSINVTGTEHVVDACLKFGVSRLVLASSVGVVFSNKEIIAGDETLPYAPFEEHTEYYANSKTLAEKHVLGKDGASFADGVVSADGETQLRTAALRFRGIYGPGEQRTTQRTIDMCRAGVMVMTFGRGSHCLTQYSSEANSTRAFRLAYLGLSRERAYRAGGQAYFIVDETPCDGFAFWRPLMACLGVPFPRLRLPYTVIYTLAFLMEMLYHATGLEPVMTRFEVNLIGLTNYYKVDKAKRELELEMVDDHNLESIIADCRRRYGKENYALKYLAIYSAVLLVLCAVFAWLLNRVRYML